jgi:hypothetical protein
MRVLAGEGLVRIVPRWGDVPGRVNARLYGPCVWAVAAAGGWMVPRRSTYVRKG